MTSEPEIFRSPYTTHKDKPWTVYVPASMLPEEVPDRSFPHICRHETEEDAKACLTNILEDLDEG